MTPPTPPSTSGPRPLVQYPQPTPSPTLPPTYPQAPTAPPLYPPGAPGAYPPGAPGAYPPGAPGSYPPGAYPPGYPGYPPPGCCTQDPSQPGCCGQQNPQQPGCFGDPAQPFINEQQGACTSLLSFCDFTTCFTLLLLIASIIAFGLVLGVKKPDDIFKIYDLGDRSSTGLSKKMFSEATAGNSSAAKLVDAVGAQSPYYYLCTQYRDIANATVLPSNECPNKRGLKGSFGSLCMPETLAATPMLMNISQWCVFRNTLYFIAMVGTFIVLILVYMIHRQRNPQPAWGQPPAPGSNPQMWQASPPIRFNGTPIWYVFRAVWFCLSIVIFLWVATQMYQFWWFIGYYKQNTVGSLHDFWKKFDKKFVASVVCVTIYLCWPLCHLALEIGLWILFVVPWYIYRMMCAPQLETLRKPPDTLLEDIPCCIRLDMFFTECNQMKRAGFSLGLWHILTDTWTPFFECCDFNQQQQWQMQQQQQQQQQPGGMIPMQPAPQQPAANSSFASAGSGPTRGFGPSPMSPPIPLAPSAGVRDSHVFSDSAAGCSSEDPHDGSPTVRKSQSGKIHKHHHHHGESSDNPLRHSSKKHRDHKEKTNDAPSTQVAPIS